MACGANYLVVGAQIATPIILGVVGWWFAHRQVDIANSKLRLDHFDKRFAVFTAARDFLGAAMQGKVAIAEEQAFLSAMAGAVFIFKNADVANYLKDIRARVIELHFLDVDMAHASTEEERKAAGAKWLDQRRWMRDQYDQLEAKFMPHMQLRD
jgi:hypothetical protein